MHPVVLLGHGADPFFQPAVHQRRVGRHVLARVVGPGRVHLHLVALRRHARDGGHHARAPQPRQPRQRGHGGGRHAEEGHEEGFLRPQVHVGQQVQVAALAQRLDDRLDTVAPVDQHHVAEALAPGAHPGAATDAWVRAGRERFGDVVLINRRDGVKPVIKSLREGRYLYLLPDMDLGPEESVFVPFFGVPAATVPSLPRLARLGRARVVPTVTRMTPGGYEVQVHPAWSGYPGDDPVADTALMNRRLEDWIRTMPEQYYWVHKRFKTRPAGEPSVYGRTP
ncbi:MAG: hypothetical protein E6Q65_09760 [Ottowia sp.]|nr:MAG: hypothetical protein E6Q65_09760 [Ottowia sp.]